MPDVATLDLEIAGLIARVESTDGLLLEPLRSRWEVCPVLDERDPDLIVTLACDPALGERPMAADYPALARRVDGTRLHVERADVIGELDLAGTPLRAAFRVAGHDHSVESSLRVALSVALPRHDALVLHASAVEHAGRAQVFAGVSGAGKSTIAAMLDGAPGFSRLADELVVLAREPSGWSVHVPPFLGVAGLPRGTIRPLGALHLIVQAAGHRREGMTTGDAMRELLRHVVVYAAEPATTERVLDLVGQLVAEVPTGRLRFARDPSVSEVLT